MNRLFIFIFLGFVTFASNAQLIPNEVIVSTTERDMALLRSVKSIDSNINYVELKTLCKRLDIYLLILDTNDGIDVSESVITYLDTKHTTNYAYQNQKTQKRATPSDSRYPNQWNLALVKAEEAWDVTTGGTDVNGQEIVIAVMDDGFDIDHEDIQNNLWINPKEIIGNGMDDDFNGYIDDEHGIDLVSGSPSIISKSHGTSVMGIMGADSDNSKGITGVNWNTKVMVLSSVTNEARVIEGYDYIYQMRKRYNLSNGDNGAFVVATNYSLGIDDQFGEDHPAWCNMYDLLGDVGVVSVGATTNSNTNVDLDGDLPTTCSSPYFIGVTNTNRDDEKVTNAGYGLQNIDLSAPGRNTETLKPNSEYGTFGGTSASAPHVAGAIGLLNALPCENLSAFIKENPSESALRIREAILNGVDPLVTLDGTTATGGRLNIVNAMTDLAEYCTTDPSIPISGDLQVDYVRNDSNGRYTVFYKSPDTQPVMVSIYDMTGRLLYNASSQPGIFSRSNERLDLGGYSDGTYIVTLTMGDEIASRRFIHVTYE